METCSTCVPLNFPAGGLGNGTSTNQDNRIGGQVVHSSHFRANVLDHLFPILLCHPFGLRHNHQLLSAVLLNRKGRRRPGPQSIIGLLDRHLDVLRVLVDATDDDHVLDATVDE